MSLEIDFSEAERFISIIAESGPVTFQVENDDPTRFDVGPDHFSGPLKDVAQKLSRLNRRGAAIWMMINESDGKGRKVENITRVRAVMVDLDGAPVEPVHNAPLEPHLIVETSPGRYHAYWLVNDCPIEKFTPIQKALAKKFNGCKGISGLNVVLRVPGFWHQKSAEPHLVHICYENPGLPYSVERVIRELELDLAEPKPAAKTVSTDPNDLFKIKMALQVLPPSLGYQEWLMVGMAIHSFDPSQEGLQLWDNWSKGCEEKYKPKECARKWKSFHSGPTQLGSLFHLASPYGYHYQPPPIPDVDISGLIETSHDPSDLILPESLITNAPGLVGSISTWLTSVCTRPQPHFSLAAALAFVGALKGHRVQTARQNRTNHMILALGKTGSGKTEPGNRLDDLIAHAGIQNFAMGIPASDSGLRAGLTCRSGRAYIFWDEIGIALEGMLSRNAPHHIKCIKDLLIEISTKASSILRRKELMTKEAQKGHVDIDQPCLGFYGTAQPSIFYNALSSAHSSDGFFPRLLVFETSNHYPPERVSRYSPPPTNLIESCKYINSWPTNPSSGDLASLTINPATIEFSAPAQRLLDATRKDVMRRLESSQDGLSSGVWARTMEHIEKIALTVEERDEIGTETTTWAIDLVLKLSASMASAFTLRVSDSAVERTKKRVLQIIVDTGKQGIQHSHLIRKTQFLKDKRERDSVLMELESSGSVIAVEEEISGRKARRWMAR